MPSSTSPFLDPNRLLSVQSHVVSGYVGNRAATFPLQLLGYDVDVVNTVQFSNHTGYGHTNGHKTTPEQLDAVFKGLETNGLCRWSRCLTGYIPGAPAVQAVGREIEKLKRRAKAHGEDLLYLLDPVMGDIGKGLYVAEDVVPIYRQLLSLASIITPNQFETELLSETKITSLPTLLRALQTLHSPPNDVEHVVISSIPLPISLVEKLGLPLPSTAAPGRYTSLLDPHGRDQPKEEEGKRAKEATLKVGEPTVLVCFASTRPTQQQQQQQQPSEGNIIADALPETYGYALPTIQGYYSGVGDLFSALVLGHYQRDEPQSQDAQKAEGQERGTGGSGRRLERAVSLALLGVQIVLLKTHLSTLLSLDDNNNDKAREMDLDCIPSDDELDKEEEPHQGTKAPKDEDEDEDEADDVEPLRRPARRARRMRLRELRVVQERRALMDLAEDENEGGGWKGKRLDWDALL